MGQLIVTEFISLDGVIDSRETARIRMPAGPSTAFRRRGAAARRRSCCGPDLS